MEQTKTEAEPSPQSTGKDPSHKPDTKDSKEAGQMSNGDSKFVIVSEESVKENSESETPTNQKVSSAQKSVRWSSQLVTESPYSNYDGTGMASGGSNPYVTPSAAASTSATIKIQWLRFGMCLGDGERKWEKQRRRLRISLETLGSTVVISLHQLKAVNPSSTRAKSGEKYIQVISIDNHEFWYMGFLNYNSAVDCLQDTLQAHSLESV